MKPYASPYYVIYTDLPEDSVREISLRMTKMAEEYHARTSSFSGVIRKQLPFYVFKKPSDYYAAGGMPGSAGVFMTRGPANAADSESRLMAIAVDRSAGSPGSAGSSSSESDEERGGRTGDETWHVIQHEGFHQFAHAVIGGELPPWVNEGLAEYFGESLYTGDGFVTGVLPPRRVARVKAEIQHDAFKSVQDMMLLSHEEWNRMLTGANYDQAWSMVHFLAHGENGKYQKSFNAFMNDLGRNRKWQDAWAANFGTAEGFEAKWKAWWLALPDDPTPELYAQATASTLTSFCARAASQKQVFKDMDAFVKAADANELKAAKEDWLPPDMLTSATKAMSQEDLKWTLEPDGKGTRVVGTLADHTRLVGTYTLSGSRVGKVTVERDDLPATIERAKALAEEGKKADAKALLKGALQKHPKSGSADEARKLMAQWK